jgi:hypothetical protein
MWELWPLHHGSFLLLETMIYTYLLGNIFWNLESCMMTISAIQYCMIVIRNWLLNTEFLWLKCLQINLPTGATRLMQLVEQDLIFLPKFTQAVSNADTLVFCLMFCWSLFVIFFFFVITLFVLIRFLVSPLISSNVFLQSSLHYFNWKLLKHINVTVLIVHIGKYMNDSRRL